VVGLVGGTSPPLPAEAAEWGVGPAVAAVCPTASLPVREGRGVDDAGWLAARPPVAVFAGGADARVPAASVRRWVGALRAAQRRVDAAAATAATATAAATAAATTAAAAAATAAGGATNQAHGDNGSVGGQLPPPRPLPSRWAPLELVLHPRAGHFGPGGDEVADEAREVAFVLSCLGVPVGDGGGGDHGRQGGGHSHASTTVVTGRPPVNDRGDRPATPATRMVKSVASKADW